jgi:cellulose synthase/poly-beta-1,6-N-acetylglucosamine synthase-like glycosyltransferase
MELVSVIIPAYNAALTLPRAIDSVLAQTYPQTEIIVVNDGSDDDTEQLVTSRYPQVRYHYHDNRGLAATRNTGAALARGSFIGLLDADDEWAPEKLQRQLAVMADHPAAAVVSSHRVRVVLNQAGREVKRVPSRHADGQVAAITFAAEMRSNQICGGSCLIRRAAYEKYQGYNEQLRVSEDLDLWLRMLAGGEMILTLREPLYIFYQQYRSLRTNLDLTEVAWQMILQQWDPATNPVAAPLLTVAEHAAISQWWWLKLTYHALRLGEKQRAQRLARRAHSLRSPSLPLRWLSALAVGWPRLFYLAGRCKGFPRPTG